MKKFLFARKSTLILALGLSSLVVSCKQNTNEQQQDIETVEIEHQVETVEVPKNPERFVVLDFSILENLDALGLKPVGVPKMAMPQYLEQYKNDADLGDVGTIAEANLERVNELRPQLIFSGGRLLEQYNDIKRIAPTIQPANDGAAPFETLKTNLDYIAKIFDKEQEAQELYEELMAKANDLQEQAAAEGLTALVIMHNKGKFSAYGKGSRFGIIHDFIGINEAVEGLSTHRHGNVVSSEYILEANPDVLFVIDRNTAIASGNPLDRSFVENALVKQTEAYKNGKIIYLDSQAWYLAGAGVKSLNIMLDEIAQAFE